MIRKAANGIIAFKLKNVKEIMSIYDEFVVGMTKEQFMQVLKYVYTYPIFSIRMRAVVDTLVRTKFLQLYSRQGTVQAYRAYKNRPSPKLTCLPFLDLVLNSVQITHTST